MDLQPPKEDGFLAHLLWVSAGIIMACLSSLWAVLRETPPDLPIPRRVFLTAVIGGVLSGVFVMAILLHLYDFEHPWAILAVSVPAGFGAPLIVSAGVNALATIIKAAGEALAKQRE